VFLAVVARQRLRYRLDRCVASSVTMRGQDFRVALAGHDRTDDGHAGDASDVGYDMMQL
jgi:hypothetical protein